MTTSMKRTIDSGRVDSLGRPIKLAKNPQDNVLAKASSLPEWAHADDYEKTEYLIDKLQLDDKKNQKTLKGMLGFMGELDAFGTGRYWVKNGEIVKTMGGELPVEQVDPRAAKKALKDLAAHNPVVQSAIIKNGAQETLDDISGSKKKWWMTEDRFLSSRTPEQKELLVDNQYALAARIAGFSHLASRSINGGSDKNGKAIAETSYESVFKGSVTDGSRTADNLYSVPGLKGDVQVEPVTRYNDAAPSSEKFQGVTVRLHPDNKIPGSLLHIRSPRNGTDATSQEILAAGDARRKEFDTEFGSDHNAYVKRHPNDFNAYQRWAEARIFAQAWDNMRS